MYHVDIAQFGASQAKKWSEQGKYNLNAEELEMAHIKRDRRELYFLTKDRNNASYKKKIKEMDDILEKKKWDYKDTEAVRLWKKAHNEEMKYRQIKEI